MKIYRLDYNDTDAGNCIEWFTSQRAAQKRLSQYRKEAREQWEQDRREIAEADAAHDGLAIVNDNLVQFRPMDFGSVESVDFPKDQKGIVDWLNAHFNRDNG